MNLVMVIKQQFAALTFLFRLSTAGFVLAKYIFFLSFKKFEIWLIIVDFPVPAEPYIKATLDLANKYLNDSFFSLQSISYVDVCSQTSTEFV